MWVVIIVDEREDDPIPGAMNFYYDNYEAAYKHAAHLKRMFVTPKNTFYGLTVRLEEPFIRSEFV